MKCLYRRIHHCISLFFCDLQLSGSQYIGTTIATTSISQTETPWLLSDYSFLPFFKFWHCPFYFLSLYSEPLKCLIQMELCVCPVVTVFAHLARGLQCSCDCQFVLSFRGIDCLSILHVVDIFITFFSEGCLKCFYPLFF